MKNQKSETKQGGEATVGGAGVFLSTLSAMAKGAFAQEIDDALREVTEAALVATKRAKLTVEILVVPSGNGVGGTPLFSLVGGIKTTLPKPEQDASVFFADDAFNLTRRNPNQEEMTLTVVPGDPMPAVGAGQARAAGGK